MSELDIEAHNQNPIVSTMYITEYGETYPLLTYFFDKNELRIEIHIQFFKIKLGSYHIDFSFSNDKGEVFENLHHIMDIKPEFKLHEGDNFAADYSFYVLFDKGEIKPTNYVAIDVKIDGRDEDRLYLYLYKKMRKR
ncbi:hypothetical protein [Eupransor demetentiae]|uniref:Uncharacterized protein n=1 Tax=Eupransor demetentiae TaxID=3109584 RepID=A0ABP0EPG4_9LACO|nr:hypothetical protein R54876_GBNLAHCA_00723 [Lactobacillaceae bacterium LMG 33000]